MLSESMWHTGGRLYSLHLPSLLSAVYVGISWSEYHQLCVAHGAQTGPYAAQGAVLSVAPGRISYTFGLQVCHVARPRHLPGALLHRLSH